MEEGSNIDLKRLRYIIDLRFQEKLNAKEVNAGASTSLHAVWIYKTGARLILERFWNNIRRKINNITTVVNPNCPVISSSGQPVQAALLIEHPKKIEVIDPAQLGEVSIKIEPPEARTAFVTKDCEGCQLAPFCENIRIAAKILNDRIPVTAHQMQYVFDRTGIDVSNHPIPQGQVKNPVYDLDWKATRPPRSGPFVI